MQLLNVQKWEGKHKGEKIVIGQVLSEIQSLQLPDITGFIVNISNRTLQSTELMKNSNLTTILNNGALKQHLRDELK